MKNIIKQRLREGLLKENDMPGVFYHGTRSKFPFKSFMSNMDGNGLVSVGGKKYGGFFFTSEFENADFYTEYFIAKVRVNNSQIYNPTVGHPHPPQVLQQAIQDRKNYVIEDVLDGAQYSDILVVPHSNINDIEILEWIFVGHKESFFEELDEYFGGDNDEYDDDGNPMDNSIHKYAIEDYCEMTEMDLGYLLNIPIFSEYYNSKQ